jgi:hypothetical protein
MTTTPMDGNINVSRAITLSSYWSEPLDETTLSASTMNLTDPAGRIVPCSLRYDSFWHRLDLIPNADLEIGTRYTVSLSTAIKDLRGETLESSPTWSFTTIGDSLPIPVSGPYVSVITPGQLLENIATTAVVEVTWSQAMNAATLNPATCKLTKAWNDEEIPTTLAYSAATARLTITPTAILAENTAYILRFTDGAQSASGLPFSQHGEWQGYFRTGIEATDGSGVPATPDPGWRNPGPGGPGIGFPPANQ